MSAGNTGGNQAGSLPTPWPQGPLPQPLERLLSELIDDLRDAICNLAMLRIAVARRVPRPTQTSRRQLHRRSDLLNFKYSTKNRRPTTASVVSTANLPPSVRGITQPLASLSLQTEGGTEVEGNTGERGILGIRFCHFLKPFYCEL